MRVYSLDAFRIHGRGFRLSLRVVVALLVAACSLGLTSASTMAATPQDVDAAEVSSTSRTLREGDRGPAVRRLQRRLTALRYWLGRVDGVFGPSTAQAVMAFQKVNGLEADSVVGPATWSALSAPARVTARSRSGVVVEVDRTRQVLMLVNDGVVVRVLNTSTGRSGMETPLGRFTIFRHIDGWRHAPLGSLYRPKYFNAGIAIHGASQVPAYPASHGCARVSFRAMDWLFSRAPIGTAVWVYV